MAKKDRFYSEEEILKWFQRLRNEPKETDKKNRKNDLIGENLNNNSISAKENPFKKKVNSTGMANRQQNKKSSKGHEKQPQKKYREQSHGNRASAENHHGFGLIQGQTKTFHTDKTSKKKKGK